jgi:hypothetical protein
LVGIGSILIGMLLLMMANPVLPAAKKAVCEIFGSGCEAPEVPARMDTSSGRGAAGSVGMVAFGAFLVLLGSGLVFASLV